MLFHKLLVEDRQLIDIDQKQGRYLIQGIFHSIGIHHLYFIDHADEVVLGGVSKVLLKRIHYVIGSHDLAIMELNALLQLEGVLQAIIAHLPAFRQAGGDRTIVLSYSQRFIHLIKHSLIRVGRGHIRRHGVEDIADIHHHRILVAACSRLAAAACQQAQQHQGCQHQREFLFHFFPPNLIFLRRVLRGVQVYSPAQQHAT